MHPVSWECALFALGRAAAFYVSFPVSLPEVWGQWEGRWVWWGKVPVRSFERRWDSLVVVVGGSWTTGLSLIQRNEAASFSRLFCCVLFGAMVYSCFVLQQVSVVKSVWRKWFLVLSREQSVFHARGATFTAFMACNFSVSQMLRTYIIDLLKIHLQVHRFSKMRSLKIKMPKLYLALGLTESFSHFPISLATTYISPRLRCGGSHSNHGAFGLVPCVFHQKSVDFEPLKH